MDDVLHILDLLKQRAEADLVMLVNQKNDWVSEAKMLASSISESKINLTSIEDRQVFENWRRAQISKITNLRKQAEELEGEIAEAKAHYRIAYAKKSAAQHIADGIHRDEVLKAEETEMSAQLELTLLQTKIA